MKILFASADDAGRSQIAAAFVNALAPSDIRAFSAGNRPAAAVHPEVVAVMREAGIDLSAARPQKLTPARARAAGFLVTLGWSGDCAGFRGSRLDWPLADPQGGSIPAVRAIRDEIRNRVLSLVAEISANRGNRR
ncbi:MAG: low molecular weight phosphatase family protein [Nevskiaceae bacterium]